MALFYNKTNEIPDPVDRAKVFEELVRRIFVANGYFILEGAPSDSGVDFIVTGGDSPERLGVEVRLVRSARIPNSVTERIFEQLRESQRRLGYEQVGLVIPANLKGVDLGPADHRIRLFDLNWLISSSQKDTQLSRDLADFLMQNSPFSSQLLQDPAVLQLWQQTRPALVPEGSALVQEFTATKAGKKDAGNFESICEKALKYLFADDLKKWTRQKKVADGLHRPDLMASIIPNTDFWQALTDHFRSRFVVFEFKNYTEAIQQGQIYTTEKYLFATALRNVAIIIARNGWDASAKLAAAGALREAGKLIFCISLSDLTQMLLNKDAGKGLPEDRFVDLLDEFLLTIGR